MHSPSTCKMKLWTNRSDIIFQFLAVIIHLVIRISCDFTVTSIDKPITEGEAAYFPETTQKNKKTTSTLSRKAKQ